MDQHVPRAARQGEDIDPTNMNEVLWALVTRADPASDYEFVRKGWGSPIDPLGTLTEEGHAYNSRVIIDACIPYTKRSVFPAVAVTDSEVLQAVRARFLDT